MEEVAPMPMVRRSDELLGGYAKAPERTSRGLRFSQTQIQGGEEEDRGVTHGESL